MLALLARYGYESRNQECTLAVIQQLMKEQKISLDPKLVQSLEGYGEQQHESTVIGIRELMQYGVATEAESKELQKIKELCRNTIDGVKGILSKKIVFV